MLLGLAWRQKIRRVFFVDLAYCMSCGLYGTYNDLVFSGKVRINYGGIRP
jgi:hypothetical protein